jgi:archaellum component FlaC
MENDLPKLNKELHSTGKVVTEQNKKIYEIDQKLDDVDHNMKITDKYVSGFSSIFGFLPKLFSFGKNKKKPAKTIEEVDEKDTNAKTPNTNNNDIYDDAEILKQSAKGLRDQIKLSLKSTEQLSDKLDNTCNNANKLKTEIDKVKKTYK